MPNETIEQITFNIRQRQLEKARNGIRKVKEFKQSLRADSTTYTPQSAPEGKDSTSHLPPSQNASQSVFVNLPQPEPKKFAERKKPRPTVNEATDRKAGKDHHRKSAFASMKELKQKYPDTDVDTIWEKFKTDYNVSKRRDFTEKQWALCAARIRCLINNPHLIENIRRK